jgi:hypothetical protein
MSTTFHTYPEYEADIRAAFDTLAAQSGLSYTSGSMPRYANDALELKFGIELQTPELYVTLTGRPAFTAESFWAAAALPAYQPGIHLTSRAHAQARLAFWAQALASLLPALARGDHAALKLPDIDAAAYEYKLRTYIYDHAPIAHIARAKLWDPEWRSYADAFLKESGGKI